MTEDEKVPSRKDLREALDCAVQTIAADISTMRQELTARMDNMARTVERHTDALRVVQAGQSTITKWADTLDKDNTALGQNYFTQQRAIEDLRRRVEALERPHQQ